jgi:hypothetical protein
MKWLSAQPAPVCCTCGDSVEAVGGRRIVSTRSRGVFLIPAKGNVGVRIKRWRIEDQSVVSLGTFGPESFWTPDRIERGKNHVANGFQPWMCQRCSGRCCRSCGTPLKRPPGAMDINGNSFALLPANVPCECAAAPQATD